jgi:hypothetical protein
MSRHRFTRTTAASFVTALLVIAVAAVGNSFGRTPHHVSAIHVSGATRTALYPGAKSDVLISLINPNPYPVVVTAVSVNGAVTADPNHPGCTITGVSFADQTGLHISVPARLDATNGTARAKLFGAAAMSNASLNACQGAAFAVPLTIAANRS